ncbi:MAG: hypothetical protein RL518_182 [Pseudomonadota bacterium]|jgi:hypothetical protein
MKQVLNSARTKPLRINLSKTLHGVALSLLWLSPFSCCFAETLENIIESKAMQDFKISGTVNQNRNKASANVNQWLRGIETGTNFASLWTSSNAPHLLLNWSGAKLPYMHYKRPRSARSRDLISAEVELSTSQRDIARLSIMVPHPSIAPLVEANVFEEFRRLRPPMLETVSEKPIPLTVGQGTLYEHKKGGGSLLIPIAQNGVINITIADFKRSQLLIDIAKGLDIERLNRKLDS